MNAKLKLLMAIAFSLCGARASAETLRVTFQSAGQIESGTAVSNLALNVVQSPLQVSGWDDGNGAQSTDFSIGDGRHGVFDVSTYSIYDSDPSTASVIDLDTDRFPDLQFTSFRLRAGYTIRPLGSRPLTLRSQSTFRIDATAVIDCSGENGSTNAGPFATPSGGRGHCGGGAGGSGASTGQPATAGEAVGGVSATAGGPGVMASHGGGGGSGLDNTPDNALAGAANPGTGGAAGTYPMPFDRSFSILAGGAGGGGGAADPGVSSGAGGGAGGGGVFVYVGTDTTIDGTITANGGTGGGSVASNAGPGGGGAGGSILLFSGGTVTLTGTLMAESGLGGQTAFTPTAPSAGRGAIGRIWPVDKNGGVTANANTALVNLLSWGSIAGKANSNAISRLIDLEATRTQISSITSDDDGGVSLEVATSGSAFTSAEADWKPATSLLELSGKRYVRFRLNLATVTQVRSVEFVYTALPRENFDFGSCQMTGTSGGDSSTGSRATLLLLLLLPVLLAKSLRRAGNHQPQPSSPPTCTSRRA